MAAIAQTMKNLLNVFSGVKNAEGTPALMQMVVIRDANTNHKIKKGKIFLNSTLLPSPLFCFARTNANTSVIGMMAKVLVSFTVTALSKVADPRPYKESQVEAAAVTEDVSLMAVPAKIPKASPLLVANPISAPTVGNSTAANTLKKKITEIAWATSSSSASMTGAVAAMAEPPQMEEPTPISVEIFPGI